MASEVGLSVSCVSVHPSILLCIFLLFFIASPSGCFPIFNLIFIIIFCSSSVGLLGKLIRLKLPDTCQCLARIL